MQFIKSIGNIIGWFKSVKNSEEEEFVYDTSSDDDTNHTEEDTEEDIEEDIKKTVFTRSYLNDEEPTRIVLNCSCRGEDSECKNFHTRSTYPTITIENNKWLQEKNINDTFSSQLSVEEKLQNIYSDKYPDAFIACLKNLGYYNINTEQEKLSSQFYQLSNIIDYSEVSRSNTLEELFQKYDIEPCFENINEKVLRSVQLSKYIDSDNWTGFVNELTKEETNELLNEFEEW
jgi:hypothetical protein